MKSWLRPMVRRFLELIALRRIFVFGDSHVLVFHHGFLKRAFPLTSFDVCSVGGATASGLDNPNSVTAAYKLFKEKLAMIPEGAIIVVMLGEVDTGFVIWYRAEKYGEPVEVMFDKAVRNYTSFIGEMAARHRPIVISTPLPTITDDNDWGEVANLRKDISVSQLERTRLTLRFNDAVNRFCQQNGIAYVNLDPVSLGDDGLVSGLLLNEDQTNHHYDQEKHARLLLPGLRTALRQVSS